MIHIQIGNETLSLYTEETAKAVLQYLTKGEETLIKEAKQ